MAEPVKGKPEVDKNFTEACGKFNRLCTMATLRNCSQKVLRDVKCMLQHNLADIDKYLDIRNEQGRGGKK